MSLTPLQALFDLYSALPKAKRSELGAQYKALEDYLVLSRREPRNAADWWNDPQKRAAASAAMREAWRRRRLRQPAAKLRLSWRSSEAEKILSYDEAARVVGRTVGSLRALLGRCGGVAHFSVDDDVVTVRREKAR